MRLAKEIELEFFKKGLISALDAGSFSPIIEAKLEPVRMALSSCMGAFERNDCIDWDEVRSVLDGLSKGGSS